jgi:hypothetical protein
MKQQFAITHQHTALPQTEQLDQTLTDQHLSVLCLCENVRLFQFVCGHNILDWRLVCDPTV